MHLLYYFIYFGMKIGKREKINIAASLHFYVFLIIKKA